MLTFNLKIWVSLIFFAEFKCPICRTLASKNKLLSAEPLQT